MVVNINRLNVKHTLITAIFEQNHFYMKLLEGKVALVTGGSRGIGKGVAGLITKPVAGTIDLVTETGKGIKNTPAYLTGQKNINRSRPPGYFTGGKQALRVYDFDKSAAVWQFRQVKDVTESVQEVRMLETGQVIIEFEHHIAMMRHGDAELFVHKDKI